MIVFLTQHKELMESLVDCLEKEKHALIKEDAQSLLEIVEEKKHYINTLDNLELKRKEMFPDLNINKLEEAGLLNDELKVLADELRSLVEKISQLQETNQFLTQQSLEYSQQMISILRGNNKQNTPSYGANGKIENNSGKGNSVLDQSI